MSKETYLIKKVHPDNPESGDSAEFSRVRSAYEQVEKTFNGR